MSRTFQVTFDAHDPDHLAHFWAEALGYVLQPPPPDYETWEEWAIATGYPEENWGDRSAVIDPDESGPRVLFQRVPEGKTAKNRVHLDVNVTGRETPEDERRTIVDAEADRLAGLGATRLTDFDGTGGTWTVMQDPEGNEFCVQ
jgi:hypothetical protein